MTIIVLNAETELRYFLPYSFNMRAGQFLTQEVAPALGLQVHGENGDVHGLFVRERDYQVLFTEQDCTKYLSEILKEYDEAIFRNGVRGDAAASIGLCND